MIERKPLAPAQSRVPKSIRFTPHEWGAFTDASISRGRSDISAFVRECAIAGLGFIAAQEAMQSHSGMTAVTRRVGRA